MTASEIQKLWESQRRYFLTGNTQDLHFRKKLLKDLRNKIEAEERSLIEALMQDLGKPPYETIGAELLPCLDEIDLFVKNLDSWSARQKKFTRFWTHNHLLAKAYERPEPRGTCFVLAPWNYPVHLALIPTIGAVGAGNTVLLKPSEYSPHSSAWLEKIIADVFDPKHVKVIHGPVSLAEEALKLPFDKIFFTGSTEVGKKVMKAAAEHLSDITLELGGKCPAVFDALSSVHPVAVRRLMWGKAYNSGQTCVAPDFALIPRSSEGQFLELARETLKKFFPKDVQGSQSSRLVNEKHFDRLEGLLGSAELLVGGRKSRDHLWIEPSILRVPSLDHPLMQQEIFGPLLPLLTYEDEDSLFELLKKQSHPLALYVFTRSSLFFDRALQACPSGAALKNDVIIHLTHRELGFGGLRASGLGRYHGRRSFECFSHFRAVEEKRLSLDLPHRYFPYPSKMSKWLRRFVS